MKQAHFCAWLSGRASHGCAHLPYSDGVAADDPKGPTERTLFEQAIADTVEVVLAGPPPLEEVMEDLRLVFPAPMQLPSEGTLYTRHVMHARRSTYA